MLFKTQAVQKQQREWRKKKQETEFEIQDEYADIVKQIFDSKDDIEILVTEKAKSEDGAQPAEKWEILDEEKGNSSMGIFDLTTQADDIDDEEICLLDEDMA